MGHHPVRRRRLERQDFVGVRSLRLTQPNYLIGDGCRQR